ncbi:MAG: rhomboid family intramembrane serine protease [Bacteroidales bacterium]|nr:rhomboid family intramembrane serine protease [Bacteroidales bacterium]
MMQYQQPFNTGAFFKNLLLGRSMLSRLILINTVVFLAINFVSLIMYLSGMGTTGITGLSAVGRYLALPSNIDLLGSMPWTIFTYMFTQEGFFHLLFNLVMLYFGGMIFLEYLSEKKLLSTYLMGGIVGAVFFIAAFNLFPVFQNVASEAVAIGASASVLAIFIAIATYVPDYTVHLFLFGRIKMKYIAIAFIAIDLLSIQDGNPGGHIAHLGGALWGFVYALQLKKGTDIYKIFDWFRKPLTETRKSSMKFSTNRPKNSKPMSDVEYNTKRVATQEEIDKILDKIGKSGYASLSANEKELLFKSSNKK